MDTNNPYRAPFQPGGGLNAPFQPPNANGYIQPRPRQVMTRPVETQSAVASAAAPTAAPAGVVVTANALLSKGRISSTSGERCN